MSNVEASKGSGQISSMFRPSWRDRLTGAETSIAVTLFIVVMVGVFWVGPTFVSSSNLSIIGLYVAIPMLIAATSSPRAAAASASTAVDMPTASASAAASARISAGVS